MNDSWFQLKAISKRKVINLYLQDAFEKSINCRDTNRGQIPSYCILLYKQYIFCNKMLLLIRRCMHVNNLKSIVTLTPWVHVSGLGMCAIMLILLLSMGQIYYFIKSKIIDSQCYNNTYPSLNLRKKQLSCGDTVRHSVLSLALLAY